MNADASFLENGVILIGNLMIGGGSGNYYEFPPAFFATYSALKRTFGETTGDLSMYMIGTYLHFLHRVAQVSPMTIIGLGVAFFK